MKKNTTTVFIILFFMFFIAYKPINSYAGNFDHVAGTMCGDAAAQWSAGQSGGSGGNCPFSGGGGGKGGGSRVDIGGGGGGRGGSNVEYNGGTRDGGGGVDQTYSIAPASKDRNAFNKISNAAKSTKRNSSSLDKINNAAKQVTPQKDIAPVVDPDLIEQPMIEPWLITKDDVVKDIAPDVIAKAKEKVKKMQKAFNEAKKKVDAAKKALEVVINSTRHPIGVGVSKCICGASFAVSPQGFDAMEAHEKSCEVKIKHDKKIEPAQKTFEETEKKVIAAEKKFREAQKALENNTGGTGTGTVDPVFEELSKAFKKASKELTDAVQENKEAKKALEDAKKYPETPEEKDKNKKIAEAKKALEAAKKIMAEAKKNLDAAKKELAKLQKNDPIIVIDDPIPFPVPNPFPNPPDLIKPFIKLFQQMLQTLIQDSLKDFFSFFFSSISFQTGNQQPQTITTTSFQGGGLPEKNGSPNEISVND